MKPNSYLLGELFAILLLICPKEAARSETVLWAKEVLGFSSEFSSPQYSANQVLGKPSVMPNFGISPSAWMPAGPTGGDEWIKVGFGSSIHVRRVAVAENINPGTITRVILLDSLEKEHIIYEAEPEQNPITLPGKMLNIQVKETPYTVKTLIMYLSTKYVDVCEVDAIAISDSDLPINYSINTLPGDSLKNKPQNLGPHVNTEYYELAPVISIDNKVLYFTREGHPDNIGVDKKQDVWYSRMDSGSRFSQAENIGPPINNQFRNFAFSVSPSGNALLLGNVYNTDGTMSKGLSISYYREGHWSFPEEIRIDGFYNKRNSSAYFLSSNGKLLLMSVERDDTHGGLDIYASFLKKDGTWSEPFNLGEGINTASDEVSPFLAADGLTLYYSTSGFCGYGNNDIFMTRRLDSTWKSWSEPVNLGEGINTPGGDAYLNIPGSGEYAYLVSNDNSYGNDDIFRVKLPEALKPRPVVLVSGRVLNKENNMPLEARIRYEILPNGTEAGVATTASGGGGYRIVLPAGHKYGFHAQADSFISVDENIDLRNVDRYSEIKKDLYLVPIKEGQTVRLNNIFFEFDKASLLEGSFAELDRVVEFLTDNPGVKIEIRGHTDSLGKTDYNLALSKQRAYAVYYYLATKGVSRRRISVVAFGATQPEAPNDTEENRQKNRRVEFVIKKK